MSLFIKPGYDTLQEQREKQLVSHPVVLDKQSFNT